MIWILPIGLLLCGAYAASPTCLDGEKNLIGGTRCRKYAECENGGWYLKQCRLGEHFNSLQKSCETVISLKCKDGNAKCDEGKTFLHPGSKSLYYQCQNGRVSTKYCGAGEVFDQENEKCQVIDGLADSHKGSTRRKRSTDAECDENVKHRNGKSCRGYVDCIDGQKVNKTCPDCMNFDEIHQSCRFNILVPCGPNSDMPTLPPTTRPPPTTPSTLPPTSPSTLPPTSPSTLPPTSPSTLPPTSPTSTATTPEVTTPESTTPRSSTPGSSTPGSSTPGSSTPGSSTPGSSTPESSTSEPSAAP